MRYLSICAGIEAATVAWQPLGWQPVAFSEIETFCCAVLRHHYPTIPNWGNLHDYATWPQTDIDLLVGGTPCQPFSVAGSRQGCSDPRGTLLFTYLDVVRRYHPRWVVWENVPGVLSTHGGRDFSAFLGALAKRGYGFAYRILDAQYFGVPQRRRRLFLIGHARDWRLTAQVLFERESVCGHPAPRSETPANLATAAGTGTQRRGHRATDDRPLIAFGGGRSHRSMKVAATLNTRTRQDFRSDTLVVMPRTEQMPTAAATLAVRRLTPREYERLQGFPDDYTQVPYRGQPAADTPRYRALGNSMAVPVMRWLGERIMQVETARDISVLPSKRPR